MRSFSGPFSSAKASLVSTAPRTHCSNRPRTQLRSHVEYRPNSASAAGRLPRRARASSRDSDEEPLRAGSPASWDAETRSSTYPEGWSGCARHGCNEDSPRRLVEEARIAAGHDRRANPLAA